MICTAAEVASHAGHPPPVGGEVAEIEAQIVLYQAELESLLGRAVERASRTETRTLDIHSVRFDARHGPVHAITLVTVGGVTVPPASYYRDRNGMDLWAVYYTDTTLEVTYDGGWDEPDNLPAKNAVKARTARWLNKRTDDDVGVESSQVEGHTVKWMPDAFTETEMAACSRLRSPYLAG